MRLAIVVLAASLVPGPVCGQFGSVLSGGRDGITRYYSETPTAVVQGDSISFAAVYLNTTPEAQAIPLSCDFDVSGDLVIEALDVECGVFGETAQPGDSAWIRVRGRIASPPGDHTLRLTPGRRQIDARYSVLSEPPAQSYIDRIAVPPLFLLEIIRDDDEPLAPNVVLWKITGDALEAAGFQVVVRGEGEGIRRLMEVRPGLVVRFAVQPEARELSIELCARGPFPDAPPNRCRTASISTARTPLQLGSEITTTIHRLARPYSQRPGQG